MNQHCNCVEQTQSYNVFAHLSFMHIFNLWNPYKPRTSCTFNYEFPCMPKKKRIRAYITVNRVFLKISAQGKFFLNCFQYKWNEPSSPNTMAKHLNQFLFWLRINMFRDKQSRWNIKAFHYFLLEELRQAIACQNIILRYAKFKACNYRYHYLNK